MNSGVDDAKFFEQVVNIALVEDVSQEKLHA